MKYNFEKISEDNYRLSYKDKSFEFKSSVQAVKEMQSIVSNARRDMLLWLTEKKKTYKELTIETIKDGKKYYDNSNAKELENSYLEEAIGNYYNNMCIKLFDMDIDTLFTDIGITEDKEMQEFGIKLVGCLSGKELSPQQIAQIEKRL